jgi:uncharacterized repeat protein (TIGR03803 family)
MLSHPPRVNISLLPKLAHFLLNRAAILAIGLLSLAPACVPATAQAVQDALTPPPLPAAVAAGIAAASKSPSGPSAEFASSQSPAASRSSSHAVAAAAPAGPPPPALVVLHNFFSPSPDGYNPQSQLIQASDGNLYGTTIQGGSGDDNSGSIYMLDPDCQYTLVYSFTGGTNGSHPSTPLIEASDGNLYGLTSSGGANNTGTIYQFNLSTQAVTFVYSFADGGQPSGGDPIDDGHGTLYGTTAAGGVNNYGSIWSYDYLTQTFTTLYSFTGRSDGAYPSAGLVLASDGNLYGVAAYGGSGTAESGRGTAFELATNGSGFSVIHTFTNSVANDGAYPTTDLVEGANGDLYGTTYSGGTGPNSDGVFFSITPAGANSTFNAISDFIYPNDGIMVDLGRPFLGGDGNFYLAGSQGGANGYGQLMQVTPAGVITDLYDFHTAQDGYASTPSEQPFESTDGDLYGTTYYGGAGSSGTLFHLLVGLPPAITVRSSSPTASLGSPITLSWSANNAFSQNAQACFASSSDGTAASGGSRANPGSWSGQVPSTGSASVTPLSAGLVTYALVCGGVESARTTVKVLVPAVTTITNAPTSLTYGQTASISVAVASQSNNPPTGTVTIAATGSTLLTLTLMNGVATGIINSTSLTPGTYLLTATYNGDAKNGPSTSAPATITILKLTPTVTVRFKPATITQGATGSVTATVTNGGITTPRGTVTFYANGDTIGQAELAGSSATLVANSGSYPAGRYPVTATFNGDADNNSASGVASITIARATTTTTLSGGTKVDVGAIATFTVSVARPNLPNQPAGSVSLFYGSTRLASATLADGSAIFNLSTAGIAAGTYSVTAIYGGNVNNLPSTSTPLTVTLGYFPTK